MQETPAIRDLLVAIAIEAADKISTISTLERKDKVGVGDFVTEADTEAEKVIVKRLCERFPSCAILSEETESTVSPDNYSDHDLLFVIDPLDGTTNHFFATACGFPLPRAISIGAFVQGRPEVGIVHDLSQRRTYSAARGQGVYAEYEERKVERLLRPRIGPIGKTMVLTSWAYGDTPKGLIPGWQRIAGRVGTMRLLGSAALDLVLASIGGFPYFHNSLKPFDVGAGILFLKEMGMRATNWTGEDFTIWDKTIVAAPQETFEQFFDLVRE